MLDHLEHFILAKLVVIIRRVELASLHNQIINLKLSSSFFDNFFFNRVFSDEPINNHISLLTNSMSSSDSLKINLRVPIRVKDNYDVGLMEVDTDSTSSGRENKDLLLRVRILEIIDSFISQLRRSLTINSQILVASNPQTIIENIQKPRHLTEDEDLASFSQKSRNEVVQHAEFHRSFYDMVTIYERWTRFNLVKQVGVITHLFELHEDVQKLYPILITISVSSDDVLVELLLKLGQTDVHENFFFVG